MRAKDYTASRPHEPIAEVVKPSPVAKVINARAVLCICGVPWTSCLKCSKPRGRA